MDTSAVAVAMLFLVFFVSAYAKEWISMFCFGLATTILMMIISKTGISEGHYLHWCLLFFTGISMVLTSSSVWIYKLLFKRKVQGN